MKKLTLIKLGLLSILTLFMSIHLHSFAVFLRVSTELTTIFILSQLLGRRYNGKVIQTVKYILSSLLFFFSLADALVMTFSGTYLTVLMTSNLANLSSLSGSFALYGFGALLVLLASFMPMRYDLLGPRFLTISTLLSLFYMVAFNLQPQTKTPLFGYVDYFHSLQKLKSVNVVNVSDKTKSKALKAFEQSTIASGISPGLNQPNVIVIFAEGLSQEVLDYDHGKLMPNLNQFQKETLSFSNYYNQTAATYRAVRGQLFSAQQLNQGYENGQDQIKQNFSTPLTSVQSILGNYDYQSMFINAEPNHKIWTSYVKQLGFDQVVTGDSKKFIHLADATFMGDQQNYKELFKRAGQLHRENKPFFLADYTFQTHLSLDAQLTYGDGKNANLNKFHNMDNAFGKFLAKFKKSDWGKNTILVFTTDHASYPDQLYQKTFDTKRTYFVSPIPLMISVPGQSPRVIDAKNRNTLGFAPTLLDLVGIEHAPNYFLGTSLFTDNPKPLEYLSAIPPQYYSTADLKAKDTLENKDIINHDPSLEKQLNQFYTFSLNEKKKASGLPVAGD